MRGIIKTFKETLTKDIIMLAHFLGDNAVAAYGLITPFTNILKTLGVLFASGRYSEHLKSSISTYST
ncbi:MAG: hypothetical protein J6Z43_10120 [Clostridiales bacterium]|nr:hypothetical protein [Clostridiales bacterium]